MTYGQIRFQITKAFPKVDPDLIEGWINQRYDEIMGELPWTRLHVQSVLQTVAPYATGTVLVTLGSAALVLTSGTWTALMSGRSFRIAGRSESYTFTRVTNTTGTLDRAYEGPTAATAAYSIFDNVYALPSDCRLLEDDAFVSQLGPMRRFSRGELDVSDPLRQGTGTPQAWASRMDDSSTPPNMQVELYPVPNKAIGIPFTYVMDASPLTAASSILQVWIQSAALIEGTTAKIKAHLRDYAGAQYHTATAKSALANMRTSEAQGMGPAIFQLDGYYTSHRRKRWCR